MKKNALSLCITVYARLKQEDYVFNDSFTDTDEEIL